jgi:hypothetical protein
MTNAKRSSFIFIESYDSRKRRIGMAWKEAWKVAGQEKAVLHPGVSLGPTGLPLGLE